MQQAAQELGVRFVLEGCVRKAGSRVRVTGQLIDSKDGGHVWAARTLAIDPDDLLAKYIIACVYSQLGDLERAIDLLEQVLPHRSREQTRWFMNDSDLNPIRSHPRYQNCLR